MSPRIWLWLVLVFLCVPRLAYSGALNAQYVSSATLSTGYSWDGSANDTATILVEQFNPALGVLTGLQIHTFGELTGPTNSVLIRNTDSVNSQQFIGDVLLNIDFDGIVISPYSLTASQHVAPPSKTGPSRTLRVDMRHGSGVFEDFFDAASLTAFTGLGTVPILVTFSTWVLQTGGDLGMFEFSPQLSASAGIDITYFFEPATAVSTPEPAATALFLIGASTFAGARWRSRRRSKNAPGPMAV